MMKPREKADLVGARRAATRLIEKYKISSPQEIVLEDIAMARGVLVFEEPLEGAEARLVRKGNKGIIRVKEDILEKGRKRFVLAHEIGHWEQHAAYSQLALCSERDLEYDLTDYKKGPLEIEANAFASHLLMPSSLFRPQCIDATPNLEIIKNLAQEFRTTLTATASRFVEECKEDCMVVFSDNGEVTRWVTKEWQKEFWLMPFQSIQRDSYAWDCARNSSVPNQMQPVKAEAWFAHLQRRKKYEVLEQSMRLGRYSTVLTLLWIIDWEEDDDDDDSSWSRNLR